MNESGNNNIENKTSKLQKEILSSAKEIENYLDEK